MERCPRETLERRNCPRKLPLSAHPQEKTSSSRFDVVSLHETRPRARPKKCIAANRCVLSQALPCTTRLDSRLSETGSAGLRPPPGSPHAPRRFPPFQNRWTL